MSKKSYSEHIIPGEQTIFTISAMKGGFAEEVLMAMTKDSPLYNVRKFGPWENNVCLGSVRLPSGEEREVALKLDVEEGLFLRDAERRGFSLKHECTGELCILPISNKKRGWKEGVRNPVTVANSIFAAWIIHGEGWLDRVGNEFLWPYGIDKKRKKTYSFEVRDGSGVKLRDAIKNGAVRAAHVGTWTRPTTLVPIACGVPVVLHEFEEHAAGGNDITMLGGVKISDDDNVWGPYANFCPGAEVYVNGYKAASPFSLHVVRTKEIFPNCQLSSSFLVKKLGDGRLTRILEKIAKNSPERFYRLVNGHGVTYRLKKVVSGVGTYSNGDDEITFDIAKDGPENVLKSFTELAKVETDPSHVIEKVTRVVLDSHFFIVLFAILNAADGKSHQISGSEMYRYMIKDKTSQMHRIRNDALFELICGEFGIIKLDLFVYPASSLRLPDINQYNFNPKTWNPNHWLGKELKY